MSMFFLGASVGALFIAIVVRIATAIRKTRERKQNDETRRVENMRILACEQGQLDKKVERLADYSRTRFAELYERVSSLEVSK